MSILAAAADTSQAGATGIFIDLVFILLIGGGMSLLIICGLTRLSGRTDVHEHTGTVRHEVSGTVRHDVSGTVHHQVEHRGQVQHVHELDPTDRVRLDRLADLQLPPPRPAVVLERDTQQPVVYRYPEPHPPQVLQQRPTWPEIDQ